MWCCLQSFFSLCLACLGQILSVPDILEYFFLQHCGAEAAFLERYPTPFLQTHRAVWTLEIPVERLVMAYSKLQCFQQLNITYVYICHHMSILWYRHGMVHTYVDNIYISNIIQHLKLCSFWSLLSTQGLCTSVQRLESDPSYLRFKFQASAASGVTVVVLRGQLQWLVLRQRIVSQCRSLSRNPLDHDPLLSSLGKIDSIVPEFLAHPQTYVYFW